MTYSARQPMTDRAAVIGLLREHGITPTQQRVEIGCLLFGAHQHVSADQVLARLSGTRHGVSKATVYNTLGLFAEKGLLREVVVDPSKMFFDTNLDPHHHLYHLESGELEDIEAADVTINRMPVLPEAVDVAGVDVIIRVKPSAR
ncbi:transcriptional repressor [Acidihalobacter aeolianus]|uniref:Ferric uptake regulation protein n=1 Tax=Acidihalobacter aeolianus TaxID=2792603 RepID=A0A1D8K593_9GAMM|nr:Fur family transcriptional regulator [Acidihalobacter aeolianus]AOV16120.1 transcriptional repressor [Acidihalobacter aeolianus]